jgi:hypothetical protein
MSSTLSLSFFKCTKVLINIFYFDEQYFCETPAEIALCPEGEFCKVGNVAGIPCGSKRDCPKGSSHSGNTGVVIAAVIIFLVLFLIFSIKYFIEAKVREAQRGALSKEKDDISEEATRRMTLSSIDVQNNMEESKPSSMSIGDDKDIDPSNGSSTSAASSAAANETYNISFEGVGMVLKTGVKIMNGVTGEFRPMRTCAIMGPSGAGKVIRSTTL